MNVTQKQLDQIEMDKVCNIFYEDMKDYRLYLRSRRKYGKTGNGSTLVEPEIFITQMKKAIRFAENIINNRKNYTIIAE